MTWKITSKKNEKLLFISEYLTEEFNFTELCDRYGVSRTAGYKLVNRYEEEGAEAFKDKSHARHCHPNATCAEIKQLLIDIKYRYPTWGPKKIKDWLERNDAHQSYPSSSTIGDILKKQGLVKASRRRKKVPPHTQPFSECKAPNHVWSADFKGQFRLVNGKYCYPLTIFDNYSRYLLLCEGLYHPNHKSSLKCFEKVFKEYGLPDVIKTDNGQPFAGLGIGGITQLSIFWIKLGIMPERIEPGHPEQNGRHERMHRTLKDYLLIKKNRAQQQRVLDKFINEYNYERSHEALNKKTPGDIYIKSARQMPAVIPDVTYPNNFIIRQVKTNGSIKFCGKPFYISELLHGEPIGLELIDEQRAIIYFSNVKLGLIDARKNKIIRPNV